MSLTEKTLYVHTKPWRNGSLYIFNSTQQPIPCYEFIKVRLHLTLIGMHWESKYSCGSGSVCSTGSVCSVCSVFVVCSACSACSV